MSQSSKNRPFSHRLHLVFRIAPGESVRQVMLNGQPYESGRAFAFRDGIAKLEVSGQKLRFYYHDREHDMQADVPCFHDSVTDNKHHILVVYWDKNPTTQKTWTDADGAEPCIHVVSGFKDILQDDRAFMLATFDAFSNVAEFLSAGDVSFDIGDCNLPSQCSCSSYLKGTQLTLFQHTDAGQTKYYWWVQGKSDSNFSFTREEFLSFMEQFAYRSGSRGLLTEEMVGLLCCPDHRAAEKYLASTLRHVAPEQIDLFGKAFCEPEFELIDDATQFGTRMSWNVSYLRVCEEEMACKNLLELLLRRVGLFALTSLMQDRGSFTAVWEIFAQKLCLEVLYKKICNVFSIAVCDQVSQHFAFSLAPRKMDEGPIDIAKSPRRFSAPLRPAELCLQRDGLFYCMKELLDEELLRCLFLEMRRRSDASLASVSWQTLLPGLTVEEYGDEVLVAVTGDLSVPNHELAVMDRVTCISLAELKMTEDTCMSTVVPDQRGCKARIEAIFPLNGAQVVCDARRIYLISHASNVIAYVLIRFVHDNGNGGRSMPDQLAVYQLAIYGSGAGDFNFAPSNHIQRLGVRFVSSPKDGARGGSYLLLRNDVAAGSAD